MIRRGLHATPEGLRSIKLGKTLIAGAVALFAFQAHAAVTWSITGGAYSGEAGAQHETFDALATDANEALDLTYTGGALFNANIGGVTARPPGSIGKFLSVGTSGGQTGPIDVDLSSTPAGYYGFLWGSPDSYNYVALYSDNAATVVLSGTDVFGPVKANGFQGQVVGGQYFNAFAGAGNAFTKVVFRSAGNAFETDNHAMMGAVPEPGTYALLLAGLGVVGFVARRRK